MLIERGLAANDAQARGLILAGQVSVDGAVTSKVGVLVSETAQVSVRQAAAYVSRGGVKLAAALDTFGIAVQGLTCADVGASTGGFSDCLLQRGAAHVFAIDVGYGQLAWTLRGDARVTVLERTNVRYLFSLPGGRLVDLVTIDVSFIGLKLVIPAVLPWLQGPAGSIVALIKPQFEASRRDVGRGGVIRESRVHRAVLSQALTWAQSQQLDALGLMRSPITGPAGNSEFLVWLRPGSGAGETATLVEGCLAAAQAPSLEKSAEITGETTGQIIEQIR